MLALRPRPCLATVHVQVVTRNLPIISFVFALHSSQAFFRRCLSNANIDVLLLESKHMFAMAALSIPKEYVRQQLQSLGVGEVTDEELEAYTKGNLGTLAYYSSPACGFIKV